MLMSGEARVAAELGIDGLAPILHLLIPIHFQVPRSVYVSIGLNIGMVVIDFT